MGRRVRPPNPDIAQAAEIVLDRLEESGYWMVPTPDVERREALRAELRRQARQRQMRLRTRPFVAADAPEGAEALELLIVRTDPEWRDDPEHVHRLHALGVADLLD